MTISLYELSLYAGVWHCFRRSRGRAFSLLSSPASLRRLNAISGLLLLRVGCAIPFT